MSLRTFLKKSKLIRNIYDKALIYYFRTLTLISPELNTKATYKHKFKKKLNLENPQSFHEKLLKLKLTRYNSDPLVKQCADKYAVREYIKDCGLEHILVPLLASYDKPEDIDFNSLPEQFAMKWNFGCGYNIICPDKSKLNYKETIKKLKKWSKERMYLISSEMQYADTTKKIIVEKYLKPSNGLLPADYKVYCFNGKPMAILFINNRGTKDITASFFDLDWNFISCPNKYTCKDIKIIVEKPKCLNEMITASQKLSTPFEFVRIDYYEVDGKLYIGEMTFTPAGGIFASECIINGKTMGELLQI